MIRTVAIILLILALLPPMTMGCQLGIGAQPTSTPIPPVTPLPPATPLPPSAATLTPFETKLKSAPRSMELTKIIDGYLHVRYLPPCEIVPSPAEWVAPMKLTDLRSRSYAYLNRDGTVRASDFSSEEGRATLEAALEDSSVMEQIVARPECPEIYRRVNVGQPRFCGGLDGWPDHEADGIGHPPMPKVGLSKDDPTRGTCMGNGWMGSYCWPMSGEARRCEERDDWSQLAGAETYGLIKGPRNAHMTVVGGSTYSGRVSRIRMFPMWEEPSILKLGAVVKLGEEAYSLHVQDGDTIAQFPKPDIPGGLYLLVASYESPLGEVEYGFKVELKDSRVRE